MALLKLVGNWYNSHIQNIQGLNDNLVCLVVRRFPFASGSLTQDSLPRLKDLNIAVGEKVSKSWIPEFIHLTLRSSWKLLISQPDP